MAKHTDRTYETVTRDLTDEEMRATADELARKVREGMQVKDSRATAVAGYAAQLKAITEEIAVLSDRYTAGTVAEDVEVMTMFDEPAPGKKTVIRCDNNKAIRTEDMTARERQGSFGFAEPDDPRPEK
jgi:phosphopantetheine adenylyltransferase